MSTIYRTLNEKLGGRSVTEFVGNEGELFWDPTTATLRVSDGSTVGGIPISTGLVDNIGYRAHKAIVNRIWADDAAINQILIYRIPEGANNNTPTVFAKYRNVENEDDDLMYEGLRQVEQFFVINVYTAENTTPIFDLQNPPADISKLKDFVCKFVDLVVFNGLSDNDGAVYESNLTTLQQRFYDNFAALKATLPPLYDGFEYWENNLIDGNTVTLSNLSTDTSTSDAELEIRANVVTTNDVVEYRYVAAGINSGGAGFEVGQTMVVLGSNILQFDGPVYGLDEDHDVTITITEVDGGGSIGAFTATGNARQVYPTNHIGDGGDDQYDTGNFINLKYSDGIEDPEISYSNEEAAIIGEGNAEYIVAYKNSIWGMFFNNPNSYIDRLWYSGGLGQDGDGFRHLDYLIGGMNVEFLRDVPQTQSLNNDHTLEFTDRGGHVYANNPDNTITITVPENSNVALPIGTEISIATGPQVAYVNPGGENVVVYYNGSSSNWIIPSRARATLLKVEDNIWILDGQGIGD